MLGKGSLIHRHKAAIRRSEYSLPVKCLLRDGIATVERDLFDYGCGHGDDLAALEAMGIACRGFDPAFRPDAPKVTSSIVNLGFVLNVIEDVEERLETLKDAWRLTRDVLCVAARILVSDLTGADVEFGDGVLTRIGTFQKFFSQAELRLYLEEVLGQECFPAAPGVFYVFRNEQLKSTYLATRYRCRISAPKKRVSEIRYEEHRDILDPLIDCVTELGRLPEPDEFSLAEPVIEIFGSLNKAFALIKRVTSDCDWLAVRWQRSEDLLVYLALANFDKRPRLSRLPLKINNDVRAFFGSYKSACAEADDLLYRAGNPEEIDSACIRSKIGRLCPSSLWIHKSIREQLSPLLRIYEGCARAYIGDVEDADLIKIHRFSGKVSYLACPDFDSNPHPVTTETTKVWLRTLRVGFYRTENRSNPLLLDQKERMIDINDTRRPKFERLTNQELKHGILKQDADFRPRTYWDEALKASGFEFRGHRMVREVLNRSVPTVDLPLRCPKYGVGKRMGHALYIHKEYEELLGQELLNAKSNLPPGFVYTVVKCNESNGNLSFVQCPDFDVADEPAIGEYVVVKGDGTVSFRGALLDPYIYHHKWLFVAEDYRGFDVAKSRARSLAWLSLANIDKARIGRRGYWREHVLPRLKSRLD